MGIIRVAAAISVIGFAAAVISILILLLIRYRGIHLRNASVSGRLSDDGLDNDEDLKGTMLLSKTEKPATRNFAEFDEKTGTAVRLSRDGPQKRGKYIIKTIDTGGGNDGIQRLL